MLKSSKYHGLLLLFFAVLYFADSIGAQNDKPLEKMVISNSGELIHIDSDNQLHIYRDSTLKEGLYSYQSAIIYTRKPTPNDNPLSWAVSNSNLVYVRKIFSIHDDYLYSRLRKLDLELSGNWANFEKEFFYNSISEKSLVSESLAFDLYLNPASPNVQNSGPVYYDMLIMNNEFYIYCYVGGDRNIKVYRYNEFPLKSGIDLSQLEKEKLIQRAQEKKWERLGFIQTELTSPFKVFSRKDKIYILTDEGVLFLVQGNALVLIDKVVDDIESQLLVLDNRDDEVFLMDKSILEFDAMDLTAERIRLEAKQLIKD